MATRLATLTPSASETGCATSMLLKQAHRIIDSGLLGSAVMERGPMFPEPT